MANAAAAAVPNLNDIFCLFFSFLPSHDDIELKSISGLLSSISLSLSPPPAQFAACVCRAGLGAPTSTWQHALVNAKIEFCKHLFFICVTVSVGPLVCSSVRWSVGRSALVERRLLDVSVRP